ncbi:MAG: putative membrane protein [Paraglaciecola sp.]|jgi:putative membrane protein
MKFKTLTFLIGFLAVLIFAGFVGSQNGHLVMVNYLIAESELRVSVLMGLAFLLGILLTLTALSGYFLRLKWRIRSLERQHKKLNQAGKA